MLLHPSLSLSLSVSQRSTFGHSEALQCHFMPSNGWLSLIHHEANLQFPGTVRVRQQFVCIAGLGLFYKNKTLLVGLLQFKSSIYCKELWLLVLPVLSDGVLSAQGLQEDSGCWELLHCGWGMVNPCGRCNILIWLLSFLVRSRLHAHLVLAYEDCTEHHQKEKLLCVVGNWRKNHPHGAE